MQYYMCAAEGARFELLASKNTQIFFSLFKYKHMKLVVIISQ